MMGNPATVVPHLKSGKLRALAVTSPRPSELAPGMPTVAASGVPGYEYGAMAGMFTPSKTPAAIIIRLNQEAVRILGRQDVKERFVNSGLEAISTTPEQFSALVKSDIAKWAKVIKEAGIKGE